ncbi:MAG: hypothetical protein HYW22_00030 [Candidatus Aenigmarchaeota archaeon]|nr:hypothetical protein [Candidatus Aenigmarchaeota archaeon]
MRFLKAFLLILLLSSSIVVIAILFSPTPNPGTVYQVDMTSNGFNPRILNIKLGDTLVFVSKDTEKHWPASDIYPTNNVYPEKGGCVGSKFDACHGLSQGESYQFTFNYLGSWCYHDHLNPNLKGCVTVQ